MAAAGDGIGAVEIRIAAVFLIELFDLIRNQIHVRHAAVHVDKRFLVRIVELIVNLFIGRAVLLICIPACKRGGVALVDEKLAAVLVRPAVRHGKRTADVEEILAEFVFKRLAPDALAAAARALRVAALDHEAIDHAVECQAVIVALLNVCLEVLDRLGRRLGEKPDLDFSHVCREYGDLLARLRRIELIANLARIGNGGSSALLAAGKRENGQNGRQKRGGQPLCIFHGHRHPFKKLAAPRCGAARSILPDFRKRRKSKNNTTGQRRTADVPCSRRYVLSRSAR